jgi:hypothetical protein
MSACSQVTESGSERCLTLLPRFSTYTDMPAATDRRTQDALIVPVPPMNRTLRSRWDCVTFSASLITVRFSR